MMVAMNPGLLSLSIVLGIAGGGDPGDPVDFDRDVLPILSEHCFHCHGPDAGTRKADLRLDVHDDVLFVAEPGDPDASDLMDRVLHASPKRVMPPPAFEKPLSEAQIDVLRRWISEGVAWESHWAFAPIGEAYNPSPGQRPVVTESYSLWAKDPLDRFVLGRLLEQEMVPSQAVSYTHLTLPTTPYV